MNASAARGSADTADDAAVVAVGVDGSAASVRALAWALQYAEEHGAVVEVITAWPLHAPVFIGEVAGHFSDARWQAVQAQRQAIAHAREMSHACPLIRTRLENAEAASALAAATATASLLVLGAGGEPSAVLVPRVQAAAQCRVVIAEDQLLGAG